MADGSIQVEPRATRVTVTEASRLGSLKREPRHNYIESTDTFSE